MPFFQRRFFPNRPSLFPNRIYPLLGLVYFAVFARWALYPIGAYYIFRSARLVTWFLFLKGASPQIDDRPLAIVKKLRAWTALLVPLVIAAVAGGGVAAQLAKHLSIYSVSPALFVLSAPLVVMIVIGCAQRDARSAMWTAVRTPLCKLLFYLGTVALAFTLFAALPSEVNLDDAGWALRVRVAAFVWALLVLLFATPRVMRTGFGLGAVHPVLPPVLASVLTLECAALLGLPGGPWPITCLLLLCGPGLVIAISWWEIHRLRTLHGVTLRAG
ncbi:hypothetical protein [Actinomadura chokoriensis]|uniref:hypothetical protein n=1 Tax=Actinomadura chokoriensis TaxID=454156 RepID=UPI0031F87394